MLFFVYLRWFVVLVIYVNFFYTLFLEGVYFCEGVSGHDGSDDILRVFRVCSAMTIAVGAAEFG